MGLPLEAVLESVEEWRSGSPGTARGSEQAAVAADVEKSDAALVAQNEAALRQLQSMMPGLGV